MTKNSEKLSVAFLFDDSLDSNDGVAQYVKTIGSWLSRQGHKVTYLVGETNLDSWAGGKVISLSKNVKVSFNGNRLSMPLYSSKKLIKRVIAAEKFDVLHVQIPYSPLMAAKVIKAASSKTAVVGTFHIYPAGWLSSVGSRLLKWWLRPSLKHFYRVVSVSSAAQNFAQSGYGITSSVLPNVVEIDRFKNNAKIHPKTIVFLGRLVERKGCLELIKAFALLKETVPDAKLIIGGKGSQKASLEKFVVKNKVEGVVFVGFIAEADKSKFLGQADIACFPSLYGESFGIVLLEAMAAGAGVVLGGDNPGYRSVLGQKEGLLINPTNTAEFAARLRLLMTDRKLASALQTWQSEMIKQYDVGVVGPKLVQLYQESIDIKNKSGHN